jgi:hypothetical protein
MPDMKPHQIIAEFAASYAHRSDADVLADLAAIPPLVDEDDPCWDTGDYWQIAYRYVALADVAASRRLTDAIGLLLERASYGDPGEMMRDLRHSLEAIVNPEWSRLADICLVACRSQRRGTRLWAMDQLMILDDPRAKPVFEDALNSESPAIRSIAEIGLKRLQKAAGESRK